MANPEGAKQPDEQDDDETIAAETGRDAERALGAPEALIDDSEDSK